MTGSVDIFFQIVIREYMMADSTSLFATSSYPYLGIYNFATRTCEFYSDGYHELYFLCEFKDDLDFMTCWSYRNTEKEPCGKTLYFRGSRVNTEIFI